MTTEELMELYRALKLKQKRLLIELVKVHSDLVNVAHELGLNGIEMRTRVRKASEFLGELPEEVDLETVREKVG